MEKTLPRLLLTSFRPRPAYRGPFSLQGVLLVGARSPFALCDPVRSSASAKRSISISYFRPQYSTGSSISRILNFLSAYILDAAFWASAACPFLALIYQILRQDEEVDDESEFADPKDWQVHGQIVSHDINGVLRWRRLAGHVNIRLLTIEPGEGDLVVCSLEEYPLEHCPPYEAISYSWRTTNGQAEIVCDGVEIAVSRSLYDALRAVRKAGGRRTVWADAVCISQDDIEERSRQVQAIGRIFSQAVLVWAHVGEACTKTAGAIDLIQRFVATDSFGEDLKSLEPLLSLLERSYFQRLWIIQEICYARQTALVHGDDWIRWDDVGKLVQKLHRLLDILPTAHPLVADNIRRVACLEDIRQNFHGQDGGSGHCLLDLVMQTSSFKVTDPRDKIFALVGLAKDVTDADWEVRPDYGISNEDVYHRFTLWNLAKRADMRMLSFCGSETASADRSLPSWVPDLALADQWRRPALLAISDEPSDPRAYVIEEIPPAMFGPRAGPDHQMGFHTPRKQWTCADGIKRPRRPELKSWFMTPAGSHTSSGARKVFFSGNNRTMHLTAKQIGRVEKISIPELDLTTHEDMKLAFLLGSSHRLWPDDEARRLCSAVAMSLAEQYGWFDQVLWLTSRRRSHSTAEAVIPTLTCGRLWNGLPTPGISGAALMALYEEPEYPLSSAIASHDVNPLVSELLGRRPNSSMMSKQSSLPLFWQILAELPSDLAATDDSSSTPEDIRRAIADRLKPLENALRQGLVSVNDFRALQLRGERALLHWSRNRSFGTTHDGHLANLPGGAQPGDIIYTVLGGSVPYVFRERNDGYHELVGECYVHGFMNGEAGVPGQKGRRTQSARYPTKYLAVR